MSTPIDLKDPAVMLATLRLAYRYVLDQMDSFDTDAKRLSDDQCRELGRRLAEYWTMDPKPTDEERQWHKPSEKDPLIALLGEFVTASQRALAEDVVKLARDYPREEDGSK